MKKFKFIPTFLFSLTAPFVALAYDSKNTGLTSTGSQAGFGANPADVSVMIGTVIKAALGMVGVVFLVLMVYAGYLWMIARGDEGKVEKAKNTIINSVIGIVIVVAAYAITYYVVNALSKGPATSTPPAGQQA